MPAASGVAAFTNCKVSRGGVFTMTASAETFTQISSTFFISGPAQLSYINEPSGGAAGTTWTVRQPQVAIEDAHGNVLTSTSAIKLGIKVGTGTSGATLGCDTNPLNASAGEATFSGCEIDKTGTAYQLVATDGVDALSAVSTTFDINAGSATALTFLTEPTGGFGGQPLGTQPVVAVVDAGGNVVTGNTDSIQLSIASGGTSGAAVSCTTNPVNAIGGEATFQACSINLAGSGYVLQANDSAISASKTSSPIDIAAGSASAISFLSEPSGGAGGAAFGTQPVVALTDSGGNPIAGPVTLAIKGGTGTPGAHLSCAANPQGAISSGATFSSCSVDLTGSGYVLTATSGLLSVDSTGFSVSPGGVAKAAFSQDPVSATGGGLLSPQPIVSLTDAGGHNPADGGVALSITPGTGAPGATLTCGSNDSVSSSGGVATFSNCSIDRAGQGYTLTATSGSASSTSTAFDVGLGGPAQLAFGIEPGGGTGGSAWTEQPVVLVEDAGGNQLPTSAASIQLGVAPGTGAGAVTCAANPLPAVRGAALFSGCSIDKTANAYKLTAHDVADGLSVTSTAFTVAFGAPEHLVFSNQPGGGTAGGVFAMQPQVTVVDAGGNAVTTSGASVALTITAGTGTGGASLSCGAPTAGASSGVATFSGCSINTAASGYTLTATDGADHLSVESLPFAVLAPPPAPLLTAPTGVPPAQTFGGSLYATNPTDTTDDVNTATGALTFQVTDLRVAGIGEPLVLQRTYNSADTTGGSFGPGWTSLLDVSVTIVPNQTATVRGEDGQRVVYTWNATTQSWTPPPGARTTLQCGGKACSLTRFDGAHWDANLTATGSQIADYRAPDGQGLTFAWTAAAVTITIDTTASTPYHVVATLNPAGEVTKVATPAGRSASYGYTGTLLTSMSHVNGHQWTYAYSSNRLVSETDPLQQTRLAATYDAGGHVATLQSLGSLHHVDDTFSGWGSGTVVRGTLVNAGGSPTRASYTDTYAPGASNVLIQESTPWGAINRFAYDAHVNLTESQDPMGWVTQYTYDANNNLTSESTPITSSQSATVRMTYDQQHRILSQTDADGNLTSYVYNGSYVAQIRPPSIPHGPGSTFGYNKLGELVQVATKIGLQLCTYDAFGNQTSIVLKDLAGHALNGNGTAVTYDEAGDVLTSTDPRGTTPSPSTGFTTTHTYDAAGNLLTTVTPGPQTTTNTYDAAGTLVKLRDAANNTTTYTWNESTLSESIATNGGAPTTDVYDASGDLLSETTPANRSTTHVFDASGREVQSTDAQNITTHTTYDIESNVVALSDSAGDSVTRQYDSQNHVIRQVSNGAVTLTAYDPAGNAVSTTDPAGALITTKYSVDTKVASVTSAAGTTSYGYDAADNVTSVTDPNKHTTSYTYDGAGRQTSVTVNGSTTKYGLDVAGNVTTATDSDGRVTTYTLDALNHATSTVYTAPGTPTLGVTQAFDPLGRRIAMNDSTGGHTYHYDTAGDLTQSTGPSGTFTYDYTQPGKIVETYPDNTVVTYAVDDNMNLMSVESGTQGTSGYVKASYVRNALRETTGIAFSNGVLETQQVNQAGNVTDQNLQVAGVTIANNAFAYDAAGNRQAQVDNVGGVATTNQYGYDGSERLNGFSTSSAASSVTSPPALTPPSVPASSTGAPTGPAGGNGAATAPAPTVTPPSPTLQYDGVGNRLSAAISGGTDTYSYNAGDELTKQSAPTGSTSYAYDKNGDLTSATGPNGATTYGYDAADRLVSVKTPSQTITYASDGDGNRVSKTVGATVTATYVWDTAGAYPRLAIEQDGSGSLVRRYIYGDGPVAMQTPTATFFYHLAPDGSVAELTDGSGAIVASYHYDAFGTVTTDQSSPPANPLLFQGQYLDSDTGLYNMRAREYDATTGRFTQRDAVATPVGVPAVSPYVFVADRPTVLADPTGHSALSAVQTFWDNPLGELGANTASAGVAYANVLTQQVIKAGAKLALKSGFSYLKSKLSSSSSTVTEELAQDTGEVATAADEVPAELASADGLLGELGAEAGPEAEAVAGGGGGLAKFAGPALAVVGIGVEAYFMVEDCEHASAYKCAGDVVGVAISIAVTVACTVLTEGAGAFACNLAGGILAASISFVITTFGPQIVAGVVSLYDDAAAALGPEIPVIANALESAGNAVEGAFVSAGGAIATGFNEATAAISSGFQSAVNTLVNAGYSAVQLATVLANTFQQGVTAAVGVLVSFGYSVDQVAQAVFNTFSQTAAQAAALFKNAFNYGVAQVAQLLKDVYQLAGEDAAKILKAVSYAVDEVASALNTVYGEAAATAALVLKDIGYGIQQIGAALQQVFNEADKLVAQGLQALGYVADQIATTLVGLYNDVDSAVASALQFAGFVATDIMTALHDVFSDAAQVGAAILKGLNFVADDIAGALHSVYAAVDQAAAQILENIGFAVSVVATALKDVFSDIDSAVATVLENIGNAVTDIASAIQSAFYQGIAGADALVASALKVAGFVATSIATALKTVFSDIDSAAATVLNGLGFVANDIAFALEFVFSSDSVEQIANILKNNLGMAVDTVAEALQQVFGLAAQAAAQILKNIGYAISDITNALKDVFNAVGSFVASVLKDIGEAASDIANVLGSVFGMVASDIANLLSSIGFDNSTIDAIGSAFSSFGQSVADCFSSFFSDC